MARQLKPQLYFEQKAYAEFGYDHTRITIRTGRHATLASLIERCVDNEIGYYDGPECTGLETAAKMTRRYQWLQSQGYESIFTSSYADRTVIDLTWLHVDARYGAAKVGLPDSFEGARSGVAVLNQLVASITRHGVLPYKVMDDPQYVLSALKRMKAIPIVEFTVPQSVHATHWDSELCVIPVATITKIKAAS